MRGKAWVIVGASILVGVFLILKGIERGLEQRAPAAPQGVALPIQAPATETGSGEMGLPAPKSKNTQAAPGGLPYETRMSIPTISTAPRTCEQRQNFDSVVDSMRRLSGDKFDDMVIPAARAGICRAVASGNVAGCGALDGIKIGAGMADECRGIFWNLQIFASLVKGDRTAAADACRKTPGFSRMFGSRIDDACQLELDWFSTGKPKDLCDELAAMIHSGDSNNSKGFARFCRNFTGSDGRLNCSHPLNNQRIGNAFGCQARAASLDALRASGSPAACGGDPICKALFSGSGAECSSVELELNSTYCRVALKEMDDEKVGSENEFRKANGLARWKSGDTFISQLPSEQRMKYEKHPKGLREKRKPKGTPNSASDSDSESESEEPAAK